MDEYTPEPEDQQPSDDEPTYEFKRAAEATLQRLMKFLHTFSVQVPAQTTPADIEDPHLVSGALYSIPGSLPNSFQVIKVLAVDDFGVHVRLYGNSFARRPTTVAPELLDTSPFISIAPEDAGQEWPLSVGHLPLQAATFIGMRPIYIAHEDVIPDELEEYNEWLNTDGGYL